jgi:protoheme IX farnesyltransferase
LASLSDYWRLTKPRVTLAIFLLFFLAVLASGVGGNWIAKIDRVWKLTLGSVIVLTSVAGSNSLNNRLDFDVDKLMGRTRDREIPSGKISTRAAQCFGLTFILLSLILALASYYYFPLLLIVGLSSYLLLYTVALKRHNILSVLGTCPAVASPVWIGWIVGRGYLDMAGFLTGVLVMFWGPLHLWSLATVFHEDYRRAAIPMLPAVVGVAKSCRYLVALAIILSTASLSLYFLGYYGVTYLGGMILLNSLLLAIALATVVRPSGKWNWIMYKISAPYMILALLFAATDRILV